MNVALVDNMVLPERGSFAELDLHPHLGLLALAAAADAGGHRVRIHDPKRGLKWGLLSYDGTLYDRVAGEILAGDPDIVGFTTLGCSFIFTAGVAACLTCAGPDPARRPTRDDAPPRDLEALRSSTAAPRSGRDVCAGIDAP
jgi:hypothetical protein